MVSECQSSLATNCERWIRMCGAHQRTPAKEDQLGINWGSTEDQLRQVTNETTFLISFKARPVPTQRALAASQPRRPLARGSLSSCENIDDMINPFHTEFGTPFSTDMAACSYYTASMQCTEAKDQKSGDAA